MLNSGVFDELPDQAYESFKTGFEELTDIQLSLYKEKQMKRRINTLIERKGCSDYGEYLDRLRSDAGELAYFVDYITINVTEFFRTPEHWKCFEELVLSDLCTQKGGKLRIWSCACSTGEEPYSLAMSMMALGGDRPFEIIATDIDEAVLKKSMEGVYDARSKDSIPKEMLPYFTPQGSALVVNDDVKQHVTFRKLDLLRDEYPKNCDLIVCRNVLIYFTEEGKTMIYERFLQSMKSGGYLFTGNTEQIIYFKAYGLKKIKNFIYHKE